MELGARAADPTIVGSVSVPAPRPERHLRAGIVLGGATAAATLLGYAVTVVLARRLGQAEYGALGALLGAATIGTIPATGVQYLVARRTVTLGFDRGRNDGTALALSALLGVVLLGLCAALSVPAGHWLHLGGPGPMLALGVALVPITVAGAVQGALLGHRRYAALGVTFIVNAIGRLLGGIGAVLLGWGVAGVMAAFAVSAVATTVVAWWISDVRSWRSSGRIGDRDLLVGVREASSTVAGIVVLSNVDILLARHYLDRETSGAYAVAALFAKAVLWGSQFVAQVTFPAFAGAGDRRRLALRAGGVTAAIGLAAVLFAWVAAEPLVRAVTGKDLAIAADLVPWFALLGLAWAVAQLLLLGAVAAGDPRPGRLLWACVAAEALAIVLVAHSSPGRVIAACLAAVAVLVVVVAALHRPRRAAAPARAGR